MLNVFELIDGRLRQVTVDLAAPPPGAPIWIDCVAPTALERGWVRTMFDLVLPDEDDFGDIEVSARVFVDARGGLQLHSSFLLDSAGDRHSVQVAFVLRDGVLFSVHGHDLPVFRLLRLRARNQPGALLDALDVLLDLYATDVEYAADALEELYEELELTSHRVLAPGGLSDAAAAQVLARVAQHEDWNGRVRRNMMDTRRALSFLLRQRVLSGHHLEEAHHILRDIDSLDNHTTFLFDKTNFLMDATVGFISINQNKIVKLFSVASVALLPPTLVASIYGMNFRHMPELDWPFGYPFALLLMAISVAIPLWLFRRRGWLG
jgi:magnesium transporter